MVYLSAAPLAILVLSTLVVSDTIEDEGEDAGTAYIRPSRHCHTTDGEGQYGEIIVSILIVKSGMEGDRGYIVFHH